MSAVRPRFEQVCNFESQASELLVAKGVVDPEQQSLPAKM